MDTNVEHESTADIPEKSAEVEALIREAREQLKESAKIKSTYTKLVQRSEASGIEMPTAEEADAAYERLKEEYLHAEPITVSPEVERFLSNATEDDMFNLLTLPIPEAARWLHERLCEFQDIDTSEPAARPLELDDIST